MSGPIRPLYDDHVMFSEIFSIAFQHGAGGFLNVFGWIYVTMYRGSISATFLVYESLHISTTHKTKFESRVIMFNRLSAICSHSMVGLSNNLLG